MEDLRKSLSSVIGNRFTFHISAEKDSTGILIMDKAGRAFAQAYWFEGEITAIYLNWLSVEAEARRKGLGTELQVIRENIGRMLGAKEAFLQVEDGQWMHDWYKRRGYVDCEDQDQEENLIWMRKQLI